MAGAQAFKLAEFPFLDVSTKISNSFKRFFAAIVATHASATRDYNVFRCFVFAQFVVMRLHGGKIKKNVLIELK